jgi:hypothetical protein
MFSILGHMEPTIYMSLYAASVWITFPSSVNWSAMLDYQHYQIAACRTIFRLWLAYYALRQHYE